MDRRAIQRKVLKKDRREREEREDTPESLLNQDGLLVLLGDQDSGGAGRLEGVDEDLVGNHVKLLLVLALHVGGASQTGPARDKKGERKWR